VSLDIKTRKEDGVTVLQVQGRLIMQNGPKLHQEIKRLVAAGDNCFLLDFSGVDYVDSFGIGQMVSIQKTVLAQSGQIRFAGFTPKVMMLLEISAVPKILEFDPDVASSLVKLSGS
jgi:anti-sigma B factor antagonist